MAAQVIAQQEISRIFLVVHPLYALYGDVFKELKTANKNRKKELLRRFHVVIKNEMHNAGLMMLDAIKTPNSIIIFIPPKEGDGSYFGQTILSLIKRARRELGRRRVVCLKPAFGFDEYLEVNMSPRSKISMERMLARAEFVREDAKRKLSKFRFAKNVTGEAVGQFQNECVRISIEHIRKIIQEMHKGVTAPVSITFTVKNLRAKF